MFACIGKVAFKDQRCCLLPELEVNLFSLYTVQLMSGLSPC